MSAAASSQGVRSQARMGRLLVWRILRVALVAYVGLVVFLMLFENRLVFFPAAYPNGDWEPRGLVFEDAAFKSADGTSLHGWYIPHENPRTVVLFLHGNAGNISGRVEFLRRLHALRVAILALDYRGYGRSEGSPSEAGVIADGRAARKWLAAKTSTPERNLVLWGESLGCAVAVDLATDSARGLILENAFTSLPDVAAYHYAWAPVRLLMRNRLSAIDKIGQYQGPLLQAHGESDTIVPYALGRRLFDAANEPKQFVRILGGDHNDPRSQQFWDGADRFLDRL